VVKGHWLKLWQFCGLLVGSILLLTACPNPAQEKSLTQIRSQLTVLSTEMHESFGKSEEERVALYKELNEDINVLQTNQANVAAENEEFQAALAAIEAKLDEYNVRMAQVNERISLVETALIDRITSLSEQVNEIGRETTIGSNPPTTRTTLQNPTPTAQPAIPQVTATPLSPADSNPEAAQMYQQVYMGYVNGNFDDAISGFERYLELYPDSQRADLAQYWIAESFFSLGEFEASLQEYDRLITQYPSSERIPAAYFSKADAYLKLDRQIEAISHLRYIVTQFPNTTVAQRAEERLRTLE
jgi:tol-pal system protein YbgF